MSHRYLQDFSRSEIPTEEARTNSSVEHKKILALLIKNIINGKNFKTIHGQQTLIYFLNLSECDKKVISNIKF